MFRGALRFPAGGGPSAPPSRSDPPVIAQLRTGLSLSRILAAEAQLRERPSDPGLRLRLAEACEAARDRVGAVLALYRLPPTAATGSLGAESDPVVRYAVHCIAIGWPDEAESALRRAEEPPAPRLRLELAAAYAERGDASRAVSLLKAVEKTDPGPEGWIEGAVTWYRCRRLAAAVAWARRAVAASPTDAARRAVLARCLVAAGEADAALKALGGSGVAVRRDLVLEVWRGRAEALSQDLARQRVGRERLGRLAVEGDPMAAFAAGRAFLRAGQYRRAVDLLSQAAVAHFQEVLCYEGLASAYQALDRPAESAWARGRSLLARGQFREAAAALQASVTGGISKPLAFIDLARALHADRKPREALAVLEAAERKWPAELDLRLFQARLLLQLERPSEVVRVLTEAASLDPRRANEPLGNLGTVFFDSQQFDRAMPVLEQAVRADDSDAHSQFYLGAIYAQRMEEPGRAEKAVTHLLRAAELQPDYSRPWMAVAAVLERKGYLSEAAACLRRAISGDPQSDAPYVRLGQLLRQQGRLLERALILRRYGAVRDHDLRRTGLEKETRDNPGDAQRRFALGDLLLREGRPDQALTELLVAVGRRPDWPQARARLADACALLGYDELREEAERGDR